MSAKATRPLGRLEWAMQAEIDDATTWRVLVILTNHADETGLAWPRVTSLAEDVRRGDRHVGRALAWLEDHGYISRLRLRSGGRLRGYLYRVLVPGSAAVSPDLIPAFAAGTELPPDWMTSITTGRVGPVATGRVGPVGQGTCTSGQEPLSSEPPSRNQHRAADASLRLLPLPDTDEGFEEFWRQYPRGRAGKPGGDGARKPTEQRWKRMTGEERRAARRGVDHYRAWCEQQETPYVAHALTWLNQERWEQWQTPAEPEPSHNGMSRLANGQEIPL